MAGPSLKGLGYEAMVQDQLAHALRILDMRLWCKAWLAHPLRVLDMRLWCKVWLAHPSRVLGMRLWCKTSWPTT